LIALPVWSNNLLAEAEPHMMLNEMTRVVFRWGLGEHSRLKFEALGWMFQSKQQA